MDLRFNEMSCMNLTMRVLVVAGNKFMVVTEAQENYLSAFGIKLEPCSFTKD